MEINSGLTTNQLLNLIRLQGMVPNATETFKDADMLSLLNIEMSIGVVPSVLQAKEEYFVFNIVTPLVANQSAYPIPSRAISNRLRDLTYLDNSGNEYEMTKVPTDEKHNYLPSNLSDSTNFRRYFLESASVNLLPKVSASPIGSLNFKIFLRPNKLVKNEEVAVVQSINTTTGVITLSNFPTKFVLTQTYDFIKSGSPHNIISINVTASALNSSSKTITFSASDLPAQLEVGDYVAFSGETCIPNIPTELHPVLAQRVRAQIMEAQGDAQGLQNATARLSEMEGKTSILIENRVDGSPTKVVSRSILTGRSRFSSNRRV